MSIISALVLAANITINQFCVDLSVKDCDVVVKFVPADTLPLVDDPKGSRRAHGYCPYKVMFINKEHWATINKWEKKELIYHELGHCILGLGHNTDISIMNSLPKDTFYHVKKNGSNWKSLLEDLKNRINGTT